MPYLFTPYSSAGLENLRNRGPKYYYIFPKQNMQLLSAAGLILEFRHIFEQSIGIVINDLFHNRFTFPTKD